MAEATETKATATVATETATVTTEAENKTDYEALYRKALADNENLTKYNKDLKAKYQNKLSDEEKLKAAQEEKEQYYAELEKELKLSKTTSTLSGFISDAETVKSIANLIVDGDLDNALNQISEYSKKTNANYERLIQESKLTNNPTPPASNASATKNWKEYSMAELNKLQETNPQEYRRILNSIK